MKLFSKQQIILTAILAGPLPAAYLISKNYSNLDQKKASAWVKFAGYLLTIITYIAIGILVELFLVQTGIFDQSRTLGYFLVILAFLSLQTVLAGIFSLTGKKTNKIITTKLAEDKDKKYSLKDLLPYLLAGIGATGYIIGVGAFWFIFLIIYLLPNLYLYNRMKKAFAAEQSRLIFSVLFFFIVAMFPLVMLVHDNPANILLIIAIYIAFYYLAILLYALLFYFLVDILLLINKLIKIIPKQVSSGLKFQRIILLFFILVTIPILAIGIYNFNHTSISKYNIEVPKKSGKLEHLKIAMAADIHLSEITSEVFVNQFIEKMNSINPDIVLLVGDVVESSQNTPKIQLFERQFRNIRSKYGVFAIEGNHELYGPCSKFSFYQNANITTIRDSVIIIENSLCLIGRRDRHNQDRKSVKELLSPVTDSLSIVLLDHQPFNLEQAYSNHVDLQLSGHTHHGQLFPLNLITESIYEISWGYQKMKNTHFFVTCGAQGWGPQVKTASHSEIMEINIEFN